MATKTEPAPRVRVPSAALIARRRRLAREQASARLVSAIRRAG